MLYYCLHHHVLGSTCVDAAACGTLSCGCSGSCIVPSDWQGYCKPSGLEGKHSKGRGQGRHLATLEKPLPLTRVSRV